MPERMQAAVPGGLILTARRELSVSGVIELLGFDPSQVEAETADGLLIVRGSELVVGKLNADTGELGVTGHIDGLVYTKRETRTKQGLLTRLLK